MKSKVEEYPILGRCLTHQRGAAFAELALIMVLALMICTAVPATGLLAVSPIVEESNAPAAGLGNDVVTHWQYQDGRLGPIATLDFRQSALRARTKMIDNGLTPDICYYACHRIGGVVSCPTSELTPSCVSNPGGALVCTNAVIAALSFTPTVDLPFACLYVVPNNQAFPVRGSTKKMPIT